MNTCQNCDKNCEKCDLPDIAMDIEKLRKTHKGEIEYLHDKIKRLEIDKENLLNIITDLQGE